MHIGTCINITGITGITLILLSTQRHVVHAVDRKFPMRNLLKMTCLLGPYNDVMK